jgi:alanyl-tRNA synthetase
MHQLVRVVAQQFRDVFPELNKQQEFVQRVVREEEAGFLRTLSNGMARLNDAMTNAGLGKRWIPGSLAFELFDTYGFPLDLTQLIAAEKGWTVDTDGFNAEMTKQRERSQQAGKVDVGDWVLLSEEPETFVGWDQLEADVRITRYREVESKGRKQYQLVFNVTPFYAESGGQIGDTGWLTSASEKTSITDTQKENNIIVHYVDVLPSNPGAAFKAVVDRDKREATVKNHSATHLLHAALRQVLGTHVQQKGSYVGPDHLRFDFSHFEKMSEQQLAEVERIVNEKIKADIVKGEERTVPFEEAKKRGAMALFGEKYGDHVRVITFDPEFSIELCGGTHAASTGVIGEFRITQESAVGAGLRRIKAVTGQGVRDYEAELRRKKADELTQGMKRDRQRQEAEVEAERVAKAREKLKSSMQSVNGFSFICEIIDVSSNESLRTLSFDLKKSGKLFMVLGANINNKPALSVAISDDLVSGKNLDAGRIIKELSKEIKGGGGGQPFFATAGGSDMSGLERAILKAKEMIRELGN